MLSAEYFTRLNIAEEQIEKGNLKKAENILKELSAFIPVRTRFYIVKAKLLAAKGEYSAAANFLSDKCDWYGNSPEKREFLTLLQEYFLKSGNNIKAAWAKQALIWPDFDTAASSLIGEAEENFLQNPQDVALQYRLFSLYIENRLLTQAAVFAALLLKNNDSSFLPTDSDLQLVFRQNRNYLADWLNRGGTVFFLDADDTRTCFDSHVMPVSLALYLSGADVYWLGDTVDCPISDISLLPETVRISLENAEDMNIAKLLRPVNAVFANGEVSNEPLLIETVIKNYSAAFYMGNGLGLEKLQYENAGYKNFIWRLSPYEHPFGETQLCFAALGNYTAFRSSLYGFDVDAALNLEPKYDFSVVVPVRDSADTLKYTLETCLNQTYTGKFEVLVSDNSVENDEVEKLCKSINNSHLRYIRTPANLSLPCSFEYAYLNAKGKFIFSVGADDGVLPWALSTLDETLSKLPDADILSWPRGSYVWPTSPIKEQRNLFLLALNSIDKGTYVSVNDTFSLLKYVLESPSSIYSVPLLYTNSGFKRSYMKYMLQQSGGLWNGPQQDIYTGMKTLAINKKLFTLSIPLTIAGASGHSIGANLNAGTDKYRISDCYGYPYISSSERKLPSTRNDAKIVYTSLLRLIAEGLYPPEYENLIQYDRVFETIFSQLTKSDALFDIYLQRAKDCLSALASDEMQKKIENEVIPKLIEPVLRTENDTDERRYQIGYSENAGIFLDASVFGVSDIKGAVELAGKLYLGKVY